MAFVVEDETGLPLANSYIATAEVDVYATDRARLTENGWSSLSTEVEREARCIMASEYADLRWGAQLRGVKEFTNISDNVDGTIQGLEFPRNGCVTRDGQDVEGIPLQWKHAIIEYVLAGASLTTLFAVPEVDANGAIKSITKKAPGVEKSIEYMGGSTPGSRAPSYPIADRLAQLYVSGSSMNATAVR